MQYKRKSTFFLAITVDTIQLKFNVKPSYEQQEIQKMNADLKQDEVNYDLDF